MREKDCLRAFVCVCVCLCACVPVCVDVQMLFRKPSTSPQTTHSRQPSTGPQMTHFTRNHSNHTNTCTSGHQSLALSHTLHLRHTTHQHLPPPKGRTCCRAAPSSGDPIFQSQNQSQFLAPCFQKLMPVVLLHGSFTCVVLRSDRS